MTRAPGAGDIVDAAIASVGATLPAVLTATALVAAPAVLLAASAPLWPLPARPAVVAVPLVCAGVIALAADVLLLADAGLGRRTPALRALASAARRGPALAALLLLATLQVALSSLLLLFPGFARLGRQQAALPVLLLEDVGPVEALRRSRFLLRTQEGLALRSQATALLVVAALAALPVLLLAVVVPLPVGGSESLAATRLLAAGFVLALLALPALAGVQFVLFLARRERLEALDLQLAVQALDEATPAPVPATPAPGPRVRAERAGR